MKQVFPAKQGVTQFIAIRIVDKAGVDIPATSINTALLTLWDAETGQVLNSRNALTVKGANGGVFTDGLFTWTVAVADVPIINTRLGLGDTELHLFRLTVTHAQSGSPFTEIFGIRVERVQA